MMKNKQRLFIIFVMFVGSWQLGAGAYIHVKAYVAQQLLLSAWKKTLRGEVKVKPWSWSDTWPVARMRVPAYSEDLIILAGDSGRNLAFGPGYRFGSSAPGTKGVSMISAHRDTHFKFLEKVKPGDEIEIQTDKGNKVLYVITETKIVDKSNASIELDNNAKQLVLITCYPFNTIHPGTDFRYLVYAQEKNSIEGV